MASPQREVASTASIEKNRLRRLPLAVVAVCLAGSLGVAGAQPAKHSKDAKSDTKTAETAPATPAPVDSHSAAYYHYGLAHMYEEMATSQGRADYATQAIEEYKLALNADPSSTFLQDGLAELYMKVGRIREAVQVAQERVKANPNDVEAHRLLGRIYYRSLGEQNGASQDQMLKLATAEYETLVRLEPKSAEDHLLLGQLYELSHDSTKAEAQFKDAQGLEGGTEESLLNLARLYNEQGDTNRVISTLTALPEQDRTARIELAIASGYDQMHKPAEAEAAYRRALDIENDNADAQRGLANDLLQQDKLDEALKLYQNILVTQPQDPESYVRISEIERRQGHYDQALATLNRAKDLVPDSEELIYNEALLYDALGRFNDAETVLKKVIASTAKPDGNYAEGERNNRALFLERLANIYREQGKTVDAINCYEQMVAMGSDMKTRGYSDEVDAYRDAHEFAKAEEVAQKAAAAAPKDRDAQILYAGQLIDTGKVDEGLALLHKQLKGGPEDRITYLSIAQAELRLRRYADANAALDKADAMAKKPEDHVYVYFLRGTIADKLHHADEAESWMRKVLAIDPDNAQALNYLGYMFADRGVKLDEALALVKRAVQLDPQNYAFLDSLGWVYFHMGQYPVAEDLLQKAVDRNGGDPTLHDHLGQTFEKEGKLKLAVAQYDRALVEYSKSLPADIEPGDVARLHKRLETARVRLARNAPAKVTP